MSRADRSANAQPRFRVREETAADQRAVERIHDAAFGGPDESRLVTTLRREPDFLRALSLVAELPAEAGADGPVGHVLFTPMAITHDGGALRGAALAPVGVLPAWQRRGVGSALIREGLRRAEQVGIELVLVVGYPVYYRRFGFRREPVRRIACPYQGPAFLGLVPGGGREISTLRGRRRMRAIYPPPFRQLA